MTSNPPQSGHAIVPAVAQTWSGMPQAKEHQLLADLQNELQGCHKQTEVQVFGTWYKLRTLDPLDEDWTVIHVSGDSLYAAGKTRRAPTIAAALVAIGKTRNAMIPVEELFQLPDNLPVTERQRYEENPHLFQAWRRTAILDWLHRPNASHERVLAELYRAYLVLSQERDEALGALDPLSKSAPSGASSNSSLPEKESSFQTQVSGE